MGTEYKTTEQQIRFLESKIEQYLKVIQVNPKGEKCRIWIDWIRGWNDEIIELQKQSST